MAYFLRGVWRASLIIAFGYVLFGGFAYLLFDKQWVDGTKLMTVMTGTLWGILIIPTCWSWISYHAEERESKLPPFMARETKFWMGNLAHHYQYIIRSINKVQGYIDDATTAPYKNSYKYEYWCGVRRGLLIDKAWAERFTSNAYENHKKIRVDVSNYFSYFHENIE